MVTGSGTNYNVAVSGMTGSGTVIATIEADKAHDLVGNGNTVSSSTDNTVTYDVTAPTVTINQAVGQADPTNSATINFTVVFSETVADFATGDVTLSGTAGATTATVTGSGVNYNVAVTGMTGIGAVIATIAGGVAHDVAGNGNAASSSTDNTVTYDATAPTVSSIVFSPTLFRVNASGIATITVNEEVFGFDGGDITVTGGTKGTFSPIDATHYQVAVTAGGVAGDLTVTIPAGAFMDLVGNLLAAQVQASATASLQLPPVGNIDPSYVFAWATDAGWINFAPLDGGVTVTPGQNGCLSGYAWAENVGWISLGATNATKPYANTAANNYGVNMDSSGNLFGFAWSKSTGWINFSNIADQVSIDLNTGRFSGYAWGENVGWIHFQNTSPAYRVRTTVFGYAVTVFEFR
jgi:hypothetical protein